MKQYHSSELPTEALRRAGIETKPMYKISPKELMKKYNKSYFEEDIKALLEFLMFVVIILFMATLSYFLFTREASAQEFDLKYNPPKKQLLFFGDYLEEVSWDIDLDNAFIIPRAVNFIAKYEKFHSHCYEDAGGYSQGYGHACLGGRVSKEASKNILRAEVERLYKHIPERYKGKQAVGILSWLYNHPYGQNDYIEMLWSDPEGFEQIMKHKAENHVWIAGVRYGGLKKRREAEYQLVYNQ